ncbi:MAG: hypothetical protein WC655_26760 [Candidatus Hydrogenedentales bacterium]|jgi:hypothetical protein
MSDVEIKRGPGRPPRQEEVKQRRRRREGLGAERGLKLGIPDDLKDKEFTYRWVNDRPGRVQQLTKMDDWEKAPITTEQNAGEGTVETRVVDKTVGERAVLLRKPKEFYEADKLEEQKVLDARDEAMRRSVLPSSEGLSGPEAYIPGGRNIVGGR